MFDVFAAISTNIKMKLSCYQKKKIMFDEAFPHSPIIN